jgi:hypothetical protein
MDNSSLGEMELEQIPKEFRPSMNKRKSSWAIVLIVIIVVLFGLFWFFEKKKEGVVPITVIPTTPHREQPVEESTNNLEASVGSIEIPNYSDSL